MSYVNVVLGNNVLFLLMLLTANLKASSSELTSATGPSICSKIPPKNTQKDKRNHCQMNQTWTRRWSLASHPNLWRCFAFRAVCELGCVLKEPLFDLLSRKKESLAVTAQAFKVQGHNGDEESEREKEESKWPHQRYLASLRPTGHLSFPDKIKKKK